MHHLPYLTDKFTEPKACAPHIGGKTHTRPRTPAMKLLRSDFFRSFGIGFGAVAFALVMTRFDGAEALIAVVQ